MGSVILVVVLLVVGLMAGLQLLVRSRARAMRGQDVPALPGALGRQLAGAPRALLYFFSPSCGACKSLTPHFTALHRANPAVHLIDVSQDLGVARSFRVMGTPSVIEIRSREDRRVPRGAAACGGAGSLLLTLDRRAFLLGLQRRLQEEGVTAFWSPDQRLARVAAEVEGLCYEHRPDGAVHARWTRVEDTIALAKRMGWRRIGIATCIGFLDESARLAEILEAQGLEPMSVCCKVGSIDKSALGIAEAFKVRMLFSRHAEAPTMTPVAKDRVTGHNPVAALYGTTFYYKRLARQPITSPRDLPAGEEG